MTADREPRTQAGREWLAELTDFEGGDGPTGVLRAILAIEAEAAQWPAEGLATIGGFFPVGEAEVCTLPIGHDGPHRVREALSDD